jgi:RND family efflux transporter MFP subunit
MNRHYSSTGIANIPFCALVITLLIVAGCAEEAPPPPPKPVKALQISDPAALAEGSFPGRAAAAQVANLSFRVSGPLVELSVNVGDEVSAGTIVARIDPNDFQVMVTNTESLHAAAQAAFRRADADYNRLISAQREDPGAISQRAVDLGLAARDGARAAVSSANATAQTARDRLSYTGLTAPFDGEVVETYVENFETVIALQPIVRLVDPSSIEMTLSIPENLIGYADYVTNVRVTFDALPGVEVPATISEIGSEASQVTRTYPLTIVMDQPDGAEILPGMAGEASIQAQLPETAETGVHVPPTALFAGTDTERSYVWIIDNDVVTRREVQTGALTTTGVLVTGGLNPGELIVAAGVSALTEGQSVRVIDTGDAQ